MTKRQKFLVNSFFLTSGFLIISYLGDEKRLIGITLLAVFTLVFFAWSLYEGLRLNATLLVLILPAFFTFGVGLFWFLLPSTILARLPIFLLYAAGIYVLSLTMNIFTVSAIRTIALARAAKSVAFVLTLFTFFLLFDAIFSLKTSLLINVLIIFLVSFPLFVQGLWSVKLEPSFQKELLIYSLAFSYSLSIISTLLFFWPLSLVVSSIFLTSIVYILLGLGQAKLEGRFFKQTIREYLAVGVLIFITTLLVTSWRG